MKKHFLFMTLACMAAIISCQKEEQTVREPVSGADPVFEATILSSKTSINPATGKVSWDGDEEITITDAASTSVVYEVSSVSEGKAIFTKKASELGTLGAGPYTAVYGEDPSTPQIYSATAKALPMTAASATTSLTFSVTCGLLKIHLAATGESIGSVQVSDGVNTYTLNCPTPQSIDSGADFYVAVPAGSYGKFVFENSAGKYCMKTAKAGGEVVMAANQVQPISFGSLSFVNVFRVDSVEELTAAIASAEDGDRILLAEQTYSVPTLTIEEKGITLEGGYGSSEPQLGDIPDPAAHKAVLDGGNDHRIMNIKSSGKTVKLSGIVIQNGNNSGNAAGLNIWNGVHVILDYVNIKDNTATGQGAGFLFTGATTQVEMSNCVVSGNSADGIGANYIHGGASVSMDKCVFSGNSANGGGCMYILNNNATSLNVKITNSEFRGNSSTGRGGAIYLRSYSAGTNGVTLYLANSTFHGNSSASYGSAIDLYGSASLTCTAQIYSCTFTGNSASSGTYDGAVTTETAGQTVNIYNSIVSGNTTVGSNPNLYQKAGSITNTDSVIDGTVSDYLASSASSKAGFLTKAFKVKTAATTAGMAVATIKSNYAGGDAAFTAALGYDQWDNAREGTTVGACVTLE